MFLIPLETTFLYNIHIQNPYIFSLYNLSIYSFCVLDILLTFNIGIYIEGFIITDRK